MTFTQLVLKIKRKLWGNAVRFMRNKWLYPFLYGSYRHSLFYKNTIRVNANCYFSAIPNPGAGVGHQMANWIAGFWYAKQLGLKFAHTPFANEKWENFLGFGEGETHVEELLKRQGYRKVKLPQFHEFNEKEVLLTKKIIESYKQGNIVFMAEQDQHYKDQFGVMEHIKQKFYNAAARKDDKLIYNKNNCNIAIHIRRGDIVLGQANNNPNLRMRWQNVKYFENVLTQVIKNLQSLKPVAIYLFSQGKSEDFASFSKFDNINFCVDMDAQESFLHMVYADLLITSKSSFSYKPALLSNGIKICPQKFWHNYPDEKDWLLADEDGIFDLLHFKKITSNE